MAISHFFYMFHERYTSRSHVSRREVARIIVEFHNLSNVEIQLRSSFEPVVWKVNLARSKNIDNTVYFGCLIFMKYQTFWTRPMYSYTKYGSKIDETSCCSTQNHFCLWFDRNLTGDQSLQNFSRMYTNISDVTSRLVTWLNMTMIIH